MVSANNALLKEAFRSRSKERVLAAQVYIESFESDYSHLSAKQQARVAEVRSNLYLTALGFTAYDAT